MTFIYTEKAEIWQGEYVSRKLDIKINNHESQTLDIEDVVGLSLRKNPKRAHLLVSKVLGKHIPASPSLILAAGQTLGGLAYKALGGKLWSLDPMFNAIEDVLDGHRSHATTMSSAPKVIPCVTIGYAETATSLGYIVAQILQSPYIHSTRYGRDDMKPYGAFEETHSHATSHKLMPEKKSFLHNNLPLVLVDDEMSTGKTIMATIEELHALSAREHYVVCSLIDCRTAEDKAIMEAFAERLGIKLDVVALSHGEVSYPDTILEDVKPVLAEIEESMDSKIPDAHPKGECIITIHTGLDFKGFKHARYGVKDVNRDSKIASHLISIDDNTFYGKTLVLGTEEFMYLPLLVAREIEVMTHEVYSSSTTRSPVMPYDSEEYAIKNKLTYYLPDGDERYLYNANGFDTIVLVVEPGQSYRDFFVPNGLIDALEKTTARSIIIIQGDINDR